MAQSYRRAMDALYLLCVIIGGVALVLISAVIPWAVFTRYVLNSAASWPEPVVDLLMGLIAAFMVIWGARLCEATWGNTIADFPFLSTGVTYLPIPLGGAILFLFVIERMTLGLPPDTTGDAHATAAFD